MTLDAELVRRLARNALDEDRADDDVTTRALVPSGQQGIAVVAAKAEGVLAGLALARESFMAVDPELRWTANRADGDSIGAGDEVASVQGSLGSILRGERVALNYLSHLSGVATAANEIVRRLEGTGCQLRDTRKTIPGLRALQKYATRMGGAVNHRNDLSEGVLVKDNHLAALYQRDLAIGDAVRLCREAAPGKRVEVEVEDLEQARVAAEAGADELLLDNMTPEQVAEVVRALGSRGPRPVLEASGGITAKNARAYGETGVDFISMGEITHSARALDMSLEVEVL